MPIAGTHAGHDKRPATQPRKIAGAAARQGVNSAVKGRGIDVTTSFSRVLAAAGTR